VETVTLVVIPSFTTLIITFSAKIVAKLLTVFTDIMEPRLTALEASHRLVPHEGQKEIARRLEAVQKMEGGN